MEKMTTEESYLAQLKQCKLPSEDCYYCRFIERKLNIKKGDLNEQP